MVRAPRFEPGSSAWQADVLDHSSQVSPTTSKIQDENSVTRLRAPKDMNQQTTTQELKPIAQDVDARIANTLIRAQNDALKPATIRNIERSLRRLARHCNLLDPEDLKQYISKALTEKTIQNPTPRPVTNETKNRWLFCYDKFCKYNGIKWEKPYYKISEKVPLIPTPNDVQAVINNASKRYVTIFSILSEIACEPEELANVTRTDIDEQQGIIGIRGTKGHASGNYPLKPRISEMLRQYLAENPYDRPFPNSKAIRQVWIDTKKRAAKKLCNPRLLAIPCKNLRNYAGAQHYLRQPVRDPIDTMRYMRHKKLETTMHYLRGIILDDDPQYTCRTGNTPQEAAALIENGFEYVTGTFQDGGKQFRKRK